MTPQTTENQVQTQTRSLKKRFGAVAVLTLAAALCVGGTLASTTVEATAENVMSFGSVKTKVVQSEKRDGEYVELDEDDYSIEAPLGKIERTVRVRNTGSEPEYVRARLSMQASVAGQDELQDASSYVEYEVAGDDEWKRIEDEDGFTWYYYTQPVDPGKETSALVKRMELKNDYAAFVGEGGNFVFTAYAEAVQSEHNGDADWPDKGWPSDETTDDAGNGDSTTTDTTTTNDEGQE